MGCGSGKDIKASAGMAIQSTMVPTGMLEFDQVIRYFFINIICSDFSSARLETPRS